MKKLIMILPAFLFVSTCALAQEVAPVAKEAMQPKPSFMDSVLFVLDGKPLANRDKDGKSPLDLDPNEIKSIEVFRGDNAIRKFGDRGKNGVVVITTKKGAHKKKRQKDG